MTSDAKTPDEYFNNVPEDRKDIMNKLRDVIKDNIPDGFEEVMLYGLPGYVVPKSVYPQGYHCNPEDPVSFAGAASQKNHIAFYHMGLYSDEGLMNWITTEYEKQFGRKLDKGKSCLRFKKPEHVPLELIGELMTKITVQEFADMYASFDPRNKPKEVKPKAKKK